MDDNLQTILAWGGLILLGGGIAFAIYRLMGKGNDHPMGSNSTDPSLGDGTGGV